MIVHEACIEAQPTVQCNFRALLCPWVVAERWVQAGCNEREITEAMERLNSAFERLIIVGIIKWPGVHPSLGNYALDRKLYGN